MWKNSQCGFSVFYDAYLPNRIRETHTEASGQIRTIHNLWCGENSALKLTNKDKLPIDILVKVGWHNGTNLFLCTRPNWQCHRHD